ncbi:hypothetical protein V1514DRAFT_366597 [Lipomyces japonicus]|uniref:uncharacterized protein n=1 Tax=Lipomyces japonicus TaxID=56871 RepID=UPI0034CE1BC1
MQQAAMEPVTDPSDWIRTRLPSLSVLDSNLRCRICRDLYASPVMAECSHTFCSLCIRKCIAATRSSETPCCPICRQLVMEIKLKRNQIVEDLVDWYVKSRKELLNAANELPREEDTPKKRKADETEDIHDGIEHNSLRRSNRATKKVQYTELLLIPGDPAVVEEQPDDVVVIEDEQREESNGPACPICNKQMSEREVMLHLDACTNEQLLKNEHNNSNISSSSSSKKLGYHGMKQSSLDAKPAPLFRKIENTPTLQRLPKLQYSLLNDSKLRKVLTDMGIQSRGTRSQMQLRHTEWVNIWNANVDSRHPKSKTQLLQQLQDWESSTSKYSVKEVSTNDLSEWNKKHASEFGDLIAQARRSLGKNSKPIPWHDESENRSGEPVMVSHEDKQFSKENIVDVSNDKKLDDDHTLLGSGTPVNAEIAS